LVSLVEKLGLLSFNILATDGTLFPPASRYHGCCCFQDSCASIAVDNIVQKVRDGFLYRLDDPAGIIPGKESRVKVECANPNSPEDVKRPKITLLSLTLKNASEELSFVDANSLRFFRVEDQPGKLGLVLRLPQLNVHAVSLSSLISEPSNTFRFCCYKLPYDREARIGARRNPSSPDKAEKIFGYNAVIRTAIEPMWFIKFRVACLTIAGNAEEGNQFILLQQQIFRFHDAHPRIHLLDGKHDVLHTHEYARKKAQFL
jgi:hypothetical protein